MFWNLKRVLLLTGTLALLMLAAWVFGRPLYRGWREQNSLAQAREFFAKSDFRNAVLAARQVLVLNRDNVEASRLMANLTELLRSPAALEWRRRVAELQPGNFTNQLQFARTAIQLGQHSRATESLEAIPPAQRNHPSYHQLTAMLALTRNDPGEASLQLTEAARLDPDNKQIQLNLAVLGLHGTNATITETAMQSLRELAALPEFRTDALRQLTLAEFKNRNWTNAAAFSRELQSQTNAAFDDRLLHLRVLKESDNPDFAAYLRTLQDDARTSASLASRLAAWLTAQAQADDAARWLATLPDELQTRLEVKMARADCCVALKDWRTLQDLLQSADWGESEFLRHAMLARAARELRNDLGAQSEWRTALRATAERPRKLILLARLATAWAWQREREETLWLLVQRHPGERWAVDALTHSYIASGNTLGLQKVYSELVARHPDDLPARNNLAATSLLLNLQTERAHNLARLVYLNATNNAIFASTYAYSLYLQGRAADGLAVLEALPATELEQPNVALYHGALQSVVAPEKAKKALDLAEKGPLLPEEKALLQTARKRL